MVMNEQWIKYFGQDRWSDIEAVSRKVEQEHPFKPFIEKPRALYMAYTDLKAEFEDMKKEVSECVHCAPLLYRHVHAPHATLG